MRSALWIAERKASVSLSERLAAVSLIFDAMSRIMS